MGSQALWGWVGDDIETLPEPAARSRGADIASLEDPDERKSHLLSGALGEESMFDQTFGISWTECPPPPPRHRLAGWTGAARSVGQQ